MAYFFDAFVWYNLRLDFRCKIFGPVFYLFLTRDDEDLVADDEVEGSYKQRLLKPNHSLHHYSRCNTTLISLAEGQHEAQETTMCDFMSPCQGWQGCTGEEEDQSSPSWRIA